VSPISSKGYTGIIGAIIIKGWSQYQKKWFVGREAQSVFSKRYSVKSVWQVWSRI